MGFLIGKSFNDHRLKSYFIVNGNQEFKNMNQYRIDYQKIPISFFFFAKYKYQSVTSHISHLYISFHCWKIKVYMSNLINVCASSTLLLKRLYIWELCHTQPESQAFFVRNFRKIYFFVVALLINFNIH